MLSTIRDNVSMDCQQAYSKTFNAAELEVNEYLTKVFKNTSTVNPIEFEYLRLCNDERKKILWLTAKDDHNGFLSPRDNFHLIYPFVDASFDFKYAVISSVKDMCKQIQDAAKMGDLHTVIVNAHGSSKALILGGRSVDESRLSYDWYNKQFLTLINKGISKIEITSRIQECFSGLSKVGSVLLLACETGAEVNGAAENSFAAGLAKVTQRQVISANDKISSIGTYIFSVDPIEIRHPDHNCFQISKLLKCFKNLNEGILKNFNEKGQLENKPSIKEKSFFDTFIKELNPEASLFKSLQNVWNIKVAKNLLDRAHSRAIKNMWSLIAAISLVQIMPLQQKYRDKDIKIAGIFTFFVVCVFEQLLIIKDLLLRNDSLEDITGFYNEI